jgi:hypothetical protein
MRSVEDLLSSPNEWRNIQDVVKLSFSAMFRVIKEQDASIKALQRSLDQLASKTEVLAR